MTNPYDPPPVVSSDAKTPGRVRSYLTSRRTPIGTGVVYAMLCVCGMLFLSQFPTVPPRDASPALGATLLAVVLAMIPFLLGVDLFQWFEFNSMIVRMGGGCLTAFIFATSIHLLTGWFIRRRPRLPERFAASGV